MTGAYVVAGAVGAAAGTVTSLLALRTWGQRALLWVSAAWFGVEIVTIGALIAWSR